MRVCIFCRKSLSGDNRAKEHVLKKSWLDKFGYMKTDMHGSALSANFEVRTRKMAAGSIQTGEICANCNNGWMNSLDLAVEPIIMSLAYAPGTMETAHLTSKERKLLARWVLKVACAYIHTDQKERRHIPSTILQKIPEDGYLPDGFMAFATRHSTGIRKLAISSFDAWAPHDLLTLPQYTRLKFGVQYDNIVIGCAYIYQRSPRFSCVPGLHYPFFTRAATVEFDSHFPINDFQNEFQRDFAHVSSDLNFILAALKLN